MKVLLALVLVATFASVIAAPAPTTHSSSPGASVAPLLSCPNVDGSPENKVTVGDILAIVQAYFKDYPSPNYTLLYDLQGPYNPQDGTGGQQRVNDILTVVTKYFTVCPLVDTQVAQATRAIILDPDAAQLRACDDATLSAHGYARSSQDVPGQGVHYMKFASWDGTFDLAEPEGLVCQGNGLVAELYYMDGDVAGWGGHDVSGGGAVHSIDIDPFCSSTPCSWDGPEGWHAHSHICLAHVGTADAFATYAPDATYCASISAGSGYPVFDDDMGWMGHLWNFLPNENLLPDVDSTSNGRFADCRPPFKATTCPM
jgi:hypothetical protein